MDNLGLKHDEAALIACSGIIRNWIIEKKGDITKEVLEEILTEHRLREDQEKRSVPPSISSRFRRGSFSLIRTTS